MMACLVFVFCAMLEYALVNVCQRNGVTVRTLRAQLPSPLPLGAPEGGIGMEDLEGGRVLVRDRIREAASVRAELYSHVVRADVLI